MAQAFPVLLVIRNSEGEVRWMEVRDWLKRASDNGKKPVKQIVFEGERFDVMSVRRWREKILSATVAPWSAASGVGCAGEEVCQRCGAQAGGGTSGGRSREADHAEKREAARARCRRVHHEPESERDGGSQGLRATGSTSCLNSPMRTAMEPARAPGRRAFLACRGLACCGPLVLCGGRAGPRFSRSGNSDGWRRSE